MEKPSVRLTATWRFWLSWSRILSKIKRPGRPGRFLF